MGREVLSSIGLLILRLGAGGYMATHGWGKVQMLFDGKASDFGDPIGLGPTVSLVGAAGAEFVCSLLVAVGLFTRFAAVPVAFTMAVAAFVIHGNDPWTMGGAVRVLEDGTYAMGSSKEPALLFCTAFLALALLGGGRFALDALIFKKKAAA